MPYRIYGNRGQYVMPETPEFDTREDAVRYARRWWGIENTYIAVKEVE